MIREWAAGRLKKIRLVVSLLVVMLGILTLTVVLLTDYVPTEAWSRSSSTEERIKILKFRLLERAGYLLSPQSRNEWRKTFVSSFFDLTPSLS